MTVEETAMIANGSGGEIVRKRGKITIRYFILAISVICLASIMSNIVTFNFTVLCMSRAHTSEAVGVNQTANITYSGYTKNEKTMIFSSVAVGSLIAVTPINYLLQAYGTRMVVFVLGMLTAVATALVPIAAVQESLIYYLILRVIQGISFAACMPTTGAVTSQWAPIRQHGLFMSTLTAFGQMAAVFTMIISGQLCTSSLGWTSIYYLHSAVSFIAFTTWFFVYRDNPTDHPLVGQAELDQIAENRPTSSLHSTTTRQKIPYLAILATPTIWGIWIAAIGDLMALMLIHTFSPQYIRGILQYSVEKTGVSAASPVFFQFLVKVIAGHSSDRLNCIDETNKIRIYNSIALGMSAFFLAVLAFLPEGYPFIGVLLLTLATAMYGFNGAGFNKCASLVSRQYSQFVLGHIQIIWCLSMLLCPILVNALLGDYSIGYWQFVFLLHAAISLISNVLFCIVAKSDPAWWTDDDRVSELKKTSKYWWLNRSSALTKRNGNEKNIEGNDTIKLM